MMFSQNPYIIIQCIDANRLKHSLLLTADLLELGIPIIISLNAIDETAKKGMWIDSNVLSDILGVDVIESVTINKTGNEELKTAIGVAHLGKLSLNFGGIIADGLK